MQILVAMVLHELGHGLLAVKFPEDGSIAHDECGLQALEGSTAAAFAEAGDEAPRRASLASWRDLSIRFDKWIEPSRSTIEPWGFSWDFLRWRLTMARPSTRARPLAGRISRTLPSFPLWEPAMTTTGSLRLMWNFCMGLQNLRRERNDLHEVLRTQLAGDGAEDAGALRVVVGADDHDGVAVETQVAAVGAAHGRLRADHHGLGDLALLHGCVRRAFLDVHGDYVADMGDIGVLAFAADHGGLARAGVVGDLKDGAKLDHGRTSSNGGKFAVVDGASGLRRARLSLDGCLAGRSLGGGGGGGGFSG